MVLTITASRTTAKGDSVGNRAKFVLVNPVIPGGEEFAKIYWRWTWSDEAGDHLFVGNTCPVTIISDGVGVYITVVSLDLIDRAGTVLDSGTITLNTIINEATDIRSVTKEGSTIRVQHSGADPDIWASEASGSDTTGAGTLANPYRTLGKIIEVTLADNQTWRITGRDLLSFDQAIFDWGYECSLDDAGGLTNVEIIDQFNGTTEPRPLFRLTTTDATGNSDDFFTLGANDLTDFRFIGIDTDRNGVVATGSDTGVFLATSGNGIVTDLTIIDSISSDNRTYLDIASGTGSTHHSGIYLHSLNCTFGDASINIGVKSEFVSLESCVLTNIDGQNDQDKAVWQNCRYVTVVDNAISGFRTGSLLMFQVDDTTNSWVSGSDRSCEWVYVGDGAGFGRHNDLGFQNQKGTIDSDGFYGITLDATPSTLEGVFKFIDINGNIIGPSEVWIQEALRIDPSVHDLTDIVFRNNFAGFAATPGVPELEAYVYNGLWADMAASGTEIRLRLTCSGNTLMRFKSSNGSATNTVLRQEGDDLNNTGLEFKNNLLAINGRVNSIVREGGLFTDTDTDYDNNFFLRTNWMTGSSGTQFANDDAGGTYDVTAYLALSSHENNSGEGFFADIADFSDHLDPATGNISSNAPWVQTGSVDDALRYQFGGTVRPSSPSPGHADFGITSDTDTVIGTVRVSNWQPRRRSDIQTCVLPLADGVLRVAPGQRITALNALDDGSVQNVQWHEMGMPYPSGFTRYARIHFKVDVAAATSAGAANLPYPIYADKDVVFVSEPSAIIPWNVPGSVIGIAQLAFDLVIPSEFGFLSATHDFSVGFPGSLGTEIESDVFNTNNSVIKTFRIRGRTSPNGPGIPSFWWEMILELGMQNHVKYWFNYGNSEVRPDNNRRWEGTSLHINGPITLTFRTVSAAPLPTITVHDTDYKIPSQVRAADDRTEVLTLMDPFDSVMTDNPRRFVESPAGSGNIIEVVHNRSQFPDGASQVFSGTIGFTPSTSAEIETHEAEKVESMFSVSLDWPNHDTYGPIGFTGPLPNNQLITNAATAKSQAALLALDHWGNIINHAPHNPDNENIRAGQTEPLIIAGYGAPRADPWRNHLVVGLPPFAGTAGNSTTDFSAGAKLLHIAHGKIPDFRPYRNDAYQVACRPYHYRETDVSQLDVGGSLHNNRTVNGEILNLWSNVGAWNGRPHFNIGSAQPSFALADVLGKRVDWTFTANPNVAFFNGGAHLGIPGWSSFDREHISANTQFCYALMTGDRWFVTSELNDMSELMLMSIWPSGNVGTRGGADAYRSINLSGAGNFVLDRGFSPRSHGRNYLFMAWCALITGRQDLQDRLIDQGIITTGQRRIGQVSGIPIAASGTSLPVTLDQFAFSSGGVPFATPPQFPGSNTLAGRGVTNNVATLPWQLALTVPGAVAAQKILELSTRPNAASAAAEMARLARDQVRVISLDSWRRNGDSANRSEPAVQFWHAIDGPGSEGIPMRADQKRNNDRTFDGWAISQWGSGSGKSTNLWGSMDLSYELALNENDMEWRDILLQIYADGAIPNRLQDVRGWGETQVWNDLRLVVSNPWITRVDSQVEISVIFGGPLPIPPALHRDSFSTLAIVVTQRLLGSVDFNGPAPTPPRTSFSTLSMTVARTSSDVFMEVSFESVARALGFPDSTSFVFFLDIHKGVARDLIESPATEISFGTVSPDSFSALSIEISSNVDMSVSFEPVSPAPFVIWILEVVTGNPFAITTNLTGIINTVQEITIRLDGIMTAIDESFEMKAGNSRTIDIFIIDKDGNPADITGIISAEWVMKEEVDSSTVLLSKAIGSGISIISIQGGTRDKPLPQLRITLEPNDTQTLSSTYYHECEVSIAGDDATIFEGHIKIRPAAIV